MKCCQDRPQLFPKSRGFCVTHRPLPKWKKGKTFHPHPLASDMSYA